MVLYLMRHSKAEAENASGDRFRELSEKGRARLKEVIHILKKSPFEADVFLSSPYVRARQTGEAVLKTLGIPADLEFSEALTPSADPREALFELRSWQERGSAGIMVFSHNPLAEILAARLLPSGAPEISLHTPSILKIRFTGIVDWGVGQPERLIHPLEFGGEVFVENS